MNEKIKGIDLRVPTLPNILALNAFAHHDIITLPLGVNQTITTETLDVVEDATSRIPVIGGIFNGVIQGFHNMVFGKSPSGFKKGGVDHRLEYYGSSMVGIMSREMYRFYTGQYYTSLDKEAKGIIPFNAFQDQGDEPLSTLLSSKSNATTLNFKVTDLVEASVYNKNDLKPEVKRVEKVSTVHIAQEPKKEYAPGDEEGKNPKTFDYKWNDGDIILVDKNFNTLLDPRDEEVIARFGEQSDDKRPYVVNEGSIQAIGAGDVVLTFFSQDPTIYGYERVSIGEGKFRNSAKVSKSTRAGTTTIRFGQPKIQTIIQYKDDEGKVYREELKDYKYKYPMTISHDIQRRPNLPPPPIEEPSEREAVQLGTYSYSIDRVETEDLVEKNFEKRDVGTSEYESTKEPYKKDIWLVYYLQYSLVNYLKYEDEKYIMFASQADSGFQTSKYDGSRYYEGNRANDLVERAKMLKATRSGGKEQGYTVFFDAGKEYIGQKIHYLERSDFDYNQHLEIRPFYKSEVSDTRPSGYDAYRPYLSEPKGIYGHAYYQLKEELVKDTPRLGSKVINLGYVGARSSGKEEIK